MAKKVLHAVHDDDLKVYLDSLGLLSDLQAGNLRCKFCNNSVNFLTLHALLPDSGTIRVICSCPDCIKKLMQHLNER